MIYKSIFKKAPLVNSGFVCCIIGDESTSKADLDDYITSIDNLWLQYFTDEDEFVNQFNNLAGTNLLLSEDPITISLNSEDGVLSTIKTLSCTIRIQTTELLSDLYTGENQGVKCYVYDVLDSDYLFYGYATPCIYNQGWASKYDEVELEFISPIATLKNVSYQFVGNSPSIQPVGKIIGKCLSETNYYQYFDFPQIYTLDDDVNRTDLVTGMYLNEYNFTDEDNENWTCYDVLDEFCKFMGLTLIEWGNSNRCGFFDMYANHLQYNGTALKYNRYDLQGEVEATNVEHNKTTALNKYNVTTDSTDISLDEVYNKITVVPKLAKTIGLTDILKKDELTPYYNGSITDPFDPEFTTIQNLIINTYGSGSDTRGIYKGIWSLFISSTEGTDKKFWVWNRYMFNYDNSETYWYNKPTAADQVPSRILYPFGDYGIDPTQLYNYNGACIMEGDSTTVKYASGQFVRVNGISLQKYITLAAHRPSSHNIYSCPDIGSSGSYASYKINVDGIIPTCPLFKYKDTFKDSVSDNKYLVLNFTATYSNKQTRPFIYDDWNDDDDTQQWARFLWVQIKVGKYYLTRKNDTYRCAFTGTTEIEGDPTYTWSDTYVAPTVLLQPSHCKLFLEAKDDYIGKSMNLVSNIDWRMGIESSSGVAFKLPKDINSGDKIEITFYTPHSPNENNAIAYVFIKDLKVGIEEGLFKKFDIAENEDDIKYTNMENEPYPNKLDEFETKIYTQPKTREDSYGSIIKKVGDDYKYIENITNDYIGTKQYQEYNLIDEVYNNVHEPKTIINTSINGLDVKPWTKYNITMNLDRGMMVDSWEANVKQNETTITVREI